MSKPPQGIDVKMRPKPPQGIDVKMRAKRQRTDPPSGTQSRTTRGPEVPKSRAVPASSGERLTDEEYNKLHTRWSNVSSDEMRTISYDDFIIYMKYAIAYDRRQLEQKMIKEREARADDKKLGMKQLDEARRRILVEDKEMKKYYRKNLFDQKCFHEDIQRYGSLYVFCYGYANLESPMYKDFIRSLTDDHNNYKVYFAPNKALAYSVGLVKELTPGQEILKLGDEGYTTKEFDTGLHDIGIMLDGDDCSGVLLTNKTEDEVLSKLREYREFDFVKPGTTPMESLVFENGEVLVLPPLSSAKKLFPELKKLDMPVELSGKDIKLTKRFSVCEVGKHVTEKASKILHFLGKRMFNYVLVPIGWWSSTTKEAIYYDEDFPCRE